jgi:hypothetical protein
MEGTSDDSTPGLPGNPILDVHTVGGLVILRRDCTNWTGIVDTEDDEESPLFNGYMEEEEPEALGGYSIGTDE